jgi:hypothetical protein
MTQRTFIFALLLMLLCNAQGQKANYFEGIVKYQFNLISKTSELDSTTLKQFFGTGSTLAFKQGNYYHSYDGGVLEFDFYKKSDNKMYFKKRGNDTIFWVNCGVQGDKISKFEFTAKKKKVMGIGCDELIIHYPDKIVSHYYNENSMGINPAWFKNYTMDGENLIEEKERAIYLKSKVEYGAFTVIETAIKVSRKKVSDNIFELPVNAILMRQQ